MSSNKKHKLSTVIMAVLAVFAFSGLNLTAQGDLPDPNPIADVMYGGNSVSFLPKVNHSALTLRVTGPNGFVFEKTFAGSAAPYINLSDNGSQFVDGTYRYELFVIPEGSVKIRKDSEIAGGQFKEGTFDRYRMTPMTQSGSFLVYNGMIANPNSPEPQRVNDIVHNDDVIISFSLCVGNDCVNGESFGFDTVRLKENNLRIHFDDTSVSASFPRNDWRIAINDSSNGGASYFGVEDATAGRRVFSLEAGAPAHSLYVDDGGRLGLGTSTPVVDVHVKSGNTPTLRLEQDGTSGFTPQTWDVAGNEANFFIRDATNGSKLPFKIKPSAPTNSIYIADDGDVGLGTQTPDFTFEVERTGVGAMVVATRTDGAQMEFSATGGFGVAGTRSNHPLRLRVENRHILEINQTGNYLQVYDNAGAALGNYNGTWNDSSSRELKENIADLTDTDAENALEELHPVRYNYKHQKDEERLGFIAEDVPEIVSTKDRKTLSSMDLIAVLTTVVKKQQKTIDKLESEMKELKKKVDK